MTHLKKILFTSVCAATLGAMPAAAMELTGGDISLGYSAFSEDSDLSRMAVEGSLELGINRAFSVQFDLSHYEFGFVNEGVTSGAVHAIYHFNDTTSAGLFYGRESNSLTSIDFYGAEVGRDFGALDLEAYVGFGDESGVSATAFGIAGAYQMNDHFSVGAAYDRVDFDGDVHIYSTAFRANYEPAENVTLYGEVGSAGIGATAFGVTANLSSTYLGLGVEYAFGAKRGATFGERGLTRLLPGL